jgi:TolB protein
MNKYSVAFLTVPMLLAACFCSGEVQITVKKKFARKIAIAVPSFDNRGGGKKPLNNALADTVTADLNGSGYFDPVKNKSFIDETERDDRKTGRINFHEWGTLHAEMLLKARYTVQGKTMTVSCALYSVPGAQRIFSKTYRGNASDYVAVAHKIANDVIQAATGEKGLAGSRIAFSSDASGKKQICVMDYPSGPAKQVTGGRDISLFPHWTPDGTSLVFTSYVKGFPEIYLLNIHTRKARSLASFPGLNAFGNVSPDGRDILLTLSRTGNPEIYRMNLATGKLSRLTKTSWVESSPCWSPDGSKIAFVSSRTGTPQIYIADAWGKTTPQRVTFSGSYNTDPDWSPDGTMIAYCSRQGRNFESRIVNLKTKVDFALPKTGVDDESPSWAPDSRHIVYNAKRGKQSNLYVMDIYEKVPVQITAGFGNCSSPAWSPGVTP